MTTDSLSFCARSFRRFSLPLLLACSITIGIAETIAGYFFSYQQQLVDPDSYMRLVRIRDGLHTGWLTHIIAADNAGLGTVIYWSHLIDAVVLILRIPLLLVSDDQTSLIIAAGMTGPIIAAFLSCILIWAWIPFLHGRWLWTAPLLALVSPMIFDYGMFGNVHHHLPLVLMAVLAAVCAGRAILGHSRAGLWCGLCSAIGIWISPEVLPYMLMAMGAIGVAWCLRPAAVASAVTSCGTTFGAATTVAMLIDPPFGGWLSPEIDCISIVYVVLAVLICGASWLLIFLQRYVTSTWSRSFSCALICMAVVGLWLSFYPSLTQGLAGLMSSSDAQVFFGVISEMQPIGVDPHGISLVMTGMLAVGSALCFWSRTRNILWAYAAACGVGVVTLAVLHIRFVAYSEAVGALMIPAAMEFASSPRRSSSWQVVLRVTMLAAFLVGPFLPTLAFHEDGELAEGTNLAANCHVKDILPALFQEKNAIVLTEISDTPEILWRTPVRTVGSLYHRSVGAFIRASYAWRTGPSDCVPEAVIATGATHILASESGGRPALVSDLPPTTLQDRLMRHEVPPWLHEVAHGGGYYLYRIDNDA